MTRRTVAIALLSIIAAMPASAATDVPPSQASALVIPPARITRAVASIDGIARAVMHKTAVPGLAIAVVHDDRVLYLQGFGLRKAGKHQRVNADTIFEIASLSKPVGAAVVAAEVGRGIVSWNDPVAKYLPGFALSDPYVTRTVTIGDLYAHRSGLPDHAGDLLEDLGYSRAAIIQRLRYYPLDPFRITYYYTNFGVTAAAQAVANAAGMSWEQLSRNALYLPLGMTETSSRFSDYAKAPNHASLHVRVGNTWKALRVRNADAQSPAGGVSASIRDMAKFLRMELANGSYNGKRVIDEKALLETRTPNLTTAPLASPISRASFYGYGMDVNYDAAGRLRLSHSGALASGSATRMIMLPSERLGIVVLTNAYPVGAAETVAEQFMDLAEYGKIQREWYPLFASIFARMGANTSRLAGKSPPLNTQPPLPNGAYVGTYANRLYGDATVEARNGKLVLILGPKKMAFTLKHWTANTFGYTPPGENSRGIAAVDFRVPAGSSRATAVTLENLDAEKLGTFTR